MADTLFRLLKRDGVLGLADRCAAAVPPELRDCAFANACDLILADGVVEDAERAFLEHLQRVLELDPDTRPEHRRGDDHQEQGLRPRHRERSARVAASTSLRNEILSPRLLVC